MLNKSREYIQKETEEFSKESLGRGRGGKQRCGYAFFTTYSRTTKHNFE